MIQRGNKINVNSMNFVDANSLLGALCRSYRQENRNITYHFVDSVINNAVESLSRYGPKGYLPNPTFQEKLVRSLYTARRGISELADTYRADPDTVSKLEVCIEKIDLQLGRYQHLLQVKDPVGGGPEGGGPQEEEEVSTVIEVEPPVVDEEVVPEEKNS
jgi:hypothetical protein